jgi:hypothetical protein
MTTLGTVRTSSSETNQRAPIANSATTELLVLLAIALFGVVLSVLAAMYLPDIARSAETVHVLSSTDATTLV